ncbi:hypothetical protein ACPUVO_19830 [Pseudocolwellia sp. HL-MZ19]|uniref:hypothetical protein n=1 Tax=unclassified Pseudocolwellia TaxID=2848178 RepID=UPI003CF83ED1
MSYNYNGQQIRVMQPVHSISVNQNRVAIKDGHGLSYVTFSSSSDFKQFLSWLATS